MAVNVLGTWRDTKAWWVNVNGTWREGTSVYRKVISTWRQEAFTLPLAVSRDPASVFGFAPGGTATTGYCTTTVTGGVAPYSYLWERVSGPTFSVLEPTNYRTRFRISFTASSVYRCKVTDDDGTVVYSPTVVVESDIESEP